MQDHTPCFWFRAPVIVFTVIQEVQRMIKAPDTQWNTDK
jgi:hypothetical protein